MMTAAGQMAVWPERPYLVDQADPGGWGSQPTAVAGGAGSLLRRRVCVSASGQQRLQHDERAEGEYGHADHP
jgi:hypothetical protein